MIITGPSRAPSQVPAGLAAAASANTSFKWIERQVTGFRVYFVADSYPAAHQDSLLARLPKALTHARKLIQSPPLVGPIDLFFIESPPQMAALTGIPATGFAQPAARADVALALARRHGWIPLNSVISAFRQQPDLRAYLQAAAFTEHLLKHFRSESLKTLWRNGSQADTVIGGRSLASAENEWKGQLSATHRLSRATLARIESKGCG
jgi:hypothetical protein